MSKLEVILFVVILLWFIDLSYKYTLMKDYCKVNRQMILKLAEAGKEERGILKSIVDFLKGVYNGREDKNKDK